MNARRLVEDPSAAANMEARTKLMIAICRQVENWNVTQAEAAERLGITQPRINDLLRGRRDNFSLDALINIASRADLEVRLEAAPLTAGRPTVGAPTLGVQPQQPKKPRSVSAKRKRRSE